MKWSWELNAGLKGIIEELDPLRDYTCTMQAELDARNEHNCSQTLTQRSAYSSVLLIVPFLRVLTNVSQYYRVPTEFQSLKDEIES